MDKKITQQDIADTLSISRNSVSKVLNNVQGVGEDTKRLVIETAKKMGYKKIYKYKIEEQDFDDLTDDHDKSICIFTHEEAINNSFWAPLVKGIERVLSRAGYSVMVNIANSCEEDNCLIPKKFSDKKTDGIIMIGDYSREYIKSIKTLGIATIYIDTLAEVNESNLLGDTIMMNNIYSVYEITSHLIQAGHKEIGFAGAMNTCRSFKERWLGYKKALDDADIKPDIYIDMPEHNQYDYKELKRRLGSIKKYPSAFVCVNDRIAINLIRALSEKGINVPHDIAVAGFDNIDESTLITPNITTVHCYKEEMGERAAEEMIWRLRNPDSPYETVRISTKVIYRDSTENYMK